MRWYIIVSLIILLLAPTALASEAVGTIDIPHIVLSLAIMLLAAKLGGRSLNVNSNSLVCSVSYWPVL